MKSFFLFNVLLQTVWGVQINKRFTSVIQTIIKKHRHGMVWYGMEEICEGAPVKGRKRVFFGLVFDEF